MAQHRKQRPWRRTGHRKKPQPSPPAAVPGAFRTAATLTLAGAASAAALGGTAAADPEPSLAEIEERVDTLHREAEEATEEYNAAAEAVRRAEERLDRLRDRAARGTEELNTARDALGSQAGAAYRAGGLPPSLQLALSSAPDDFLDRVALIDRTGRRQARAVRDIEGRLLDIRRLRAEASAQADTLTDARERADDQRETVETKLAEAEELLATRTAEERERLLDEETAPGTGRADRSTTPRAADPAAAPTERAAAAVAFAYAQLGKPYGWGATGPDAFDCSGLTQAAWRTAGVALPRTSYSQVGAGTRVPRARLAPGDLVFYFSGISHVGIYVGNGQIIHASRPGTPVRLAPVDSMPIAAATRPA
ncbi:C40 family peptidase [Streptomyces sp. NBC_01803]|uniref:C40 family peptidase n=1 Tax=Streptomyces sp. NBC_01803 TaxID=2975946 RepID=UPI002DD8A1F4|nr:NlpC/P60 family protein [Streptomyces sp. NBC_01803]WSA45850.1 NlpC/P60 family protein [Streptomyces sp. NBC_01803]